MLHVIRLQSHESWMRQTINLRACPLYITASRSFFLNLYSQTLWSSIANRWASTWDNNLNWRYIYIYMAYLATVMITPMATRKHPSSWLTLYLLPRKAVDRIICHTRKVCKIIQDHFDYSSSVLPFWKGNIVGWSQACMSYWEYEY